MIMPAIAIDTASVASWARRLSLRSNSRLASWLLNACLAGLSRLSPAGRARAEKLLGFCYHRLAKRSRRVTQTNLCACFPAASSEEIAERVRRSMYSAAAMIPEVACCWKGPTDAWREMIDTVVGAEAVAAELSAGRGVLALGPHLGNWEVLNMYMGAEFGMAVLYDPPKIPGLDALVRQARERTHSRLLPIGGAGLRGLLRHLRGGGLSGLLPDQVPHPDAGCYADFFGRPALTMTFAARIIAAEQPKVFTATALRNDRGGFEIAFEDVTKQLQGLEQQPCCEAMNGLIEQLVRRAPEQYQWSYKRFKRPPAGTQRLY